MSFINKGVEVVRYKKLSQEDVIKQFKAVHGDRYQYHLVVYVGNQVKVKIVCKDHGVFEQQPANHKQGNGCPECAKSSDIRGKSGKKKFLTTLEVVAQFVAMHGERYDYSSVIYVANQTKVRIRCKTHGFFEQTPDHHKKGRGCPVCANEDRKKAMLKKPKLVYATVRDHLVATGQLPNNI